MSIKCPQCGAEFDVTLFTFDRRIRCDCGAWVDLTSGHREDEPEWCFRIEVGRPETEDDEALLADGRSVQRLRSGEWVILRDRM